jgi:uncharacterized protein (TIGR00730 family)
MNRLCVFCGSSPGKNGAYIETAHALGQCLAERRIDLVYGGASIGIMGALADAVMQNGGRAYGVIPEHLTTFEIGHTGLTELIVVKDMHERKATMAELADGFLALPGGIGTLEELIEICTWQQLQLHRKATALLNVENFYDTLLSFLDHATSERFLQPRHRNNILHGSDIPVLLDRMVYFNANPEEFITEKLESSVERNNR